MALLHTFTPGKTSDSPLAIFVHGRGGHLTIMSFFKRCIPADWATLFVQAPKTDPSIGGYSWWLIGGSDKPDESVPLLESSLREIISESGADPRFIVGLGFSQGAGMLSLLAQKDPSFFRGVAFLAGFVVPRLKSKPTKALPKFCFVHGTEDDVISVGDAREGAEFLQSFGAKVDFFTDPVGHKVGASGMRSLTHWIAAL